MQKTPPLATHDAPLDQSSKDGYTYRYVDVCMCTSTFLKKRKHGLHVLHPPPLHLGAPGILDSGGRPNCARVGMSPGEMSWHPNGLPLS